MTQNLLKYFLMFFILISVSAITSCSDSSDGVSANPTWHTVFSDNFDRADGELGPDWNVVTSTNGTLAISGNSVLYSITASSDNSIITYPDSGTGINSNNFALTLKIITDSNFSDIDAIGFIIKPSPESGKQYCLTFNKTCFTAGTRNSDSDSWTWLKTVTQNLLNNTTYYLELNVDGADFTGQIKDSGGTVLQEINVTGGDYSSWNTYFLIKSNGVNSAVRFDDYKIEAYN